MFHGRLPIWLRHAPAPGVKGFAALASIESFSRAILISVFPLLMYKTFEDPVLVSELYFLVGLASLAAGLMVPWLTRFVPRRWTYTAGALCYILGAIFAIIGGPVPTALALLSNALATVTVFVCFNAYLLDYITRNELGRSETLRLFYSAAGWAAGPVCGVSLFLWWPPAPFLLSGLSATILIIVFWVMRLGNGRLIVKARAPAPNPLAYLSRFVAQPRLIAGWLFAVIRSCGWWVYVVYLPIYAVENGLGDRLGGIALSLTNALLFATPLMLRWMRRHSVRYSVRIAFFGAGCLFAAAGPVSGLPWATVASLMLGSFFMIILDMCAGLPFLMAVKPSERTEMSAIYSSFRDVSGILTPGAAWLVLLTSPLVWIFSTTGLALLTAWLLAGQLHPRLGATKLPGLPQRPVPVVEPSGKPAG